MAKSKVKRTPIISKKKSNVATKKDNRFKVLIMSLLLPGMGQIYNGDTTKGIFLLFIAVAFGWLTGWFVYCICWIYSSIDAYQVASGKKSLGKWF